VCRTPAGRGPDGLVLFFLRLVIQFYGRHAFHLEFVGLWIDAVAVWLSRRA
jgi:hypothetical protein